MAHPSPAALPASQVAIPSQPTRYVDLYKGQDDLLNGEYAEYLEQFRPGITPLPTPQSILDRVMLSDFSIPKVFLCLIRERNGLLMTRTLHRLSRFPTSSVPSLQTRWDSKDFAFVSDVFPGNQISVVELVSTPNPFRCTPTQKVWDVPSSNEEINAGRHAEGLIGPPDSSGTTREVETRFLIPVPHAYVPLVVGKRFEPVELYLKLGSALFDDNRSMSCAVLLDWLLMAMTRRPPPGRSTSNRSPANLLGDAGSVLIPPELDSPLQSFIWRSLTTDLPALSSTSALGVAQQLTTLVGALRQDSLATRAAAEADRARQDAPKLPSHTFVGITPLWLMYSEATSEATLPPLYHTWANATKAERRILFARAVQERCLQPGAATSIPPVVSKELFNMVRNAEFAPSIFEIDDLMKGLQPFVCAFVTPHHRATLQDKAARYDSLMGADYTPTMVEERSLATTNAPIPTDAKTAKLTLDSFSVVLDVVLGPAHRLSTAIREQLLRTHWYQIEALLFGATSEFQDMLNLCMPNILRWVQLRCVSYFQLVQVGGTPPPVPNFGQLVEILMNRDYSRLPSIPPGYLKPSQPPAPYPRAPPGSGKTPASPAGTSNEPPVHTRGQPVYHPQPNDKWISRFQESGKTIAELKAEAPPIQRNGAAVGLCLSFQLRGKCFDNCSRAATHEVLQGSYAKAMEDFLDEHLPSS